MGKERLDGGKDLKEKEKIEKRTHIVKRMLPKNGKTLEKRYK